MKTVQSKAPGKLYVAGEYAVVEPGHSAIITAVDLFVTVNISQSAQAKGSIFSKGFTDDPVKWERVNKHIELEHSKDALKYVLSAIHTTEAYLNERGIPLSAFDLRIESELDNATGRKLGLGSSGAVTVATVQALLDFYGVDRTNLLVYKLSVLAQLRLGVNSSFGDIAAITYTGWIQYTSFDRHFVKAFRQEHSITETVEAYWPKLMIKKLRVAKDVHFLVGWTGSPASSDDLVGAVQQEKAQTQEQYHLFLAESKASVDLLRLGLEENNAHKIRQAISCNRQALVQMGEETNVPIETSLLTELIEIAEKHNGAAKTSGAGGGDSGIAFIFEKAQMQDIIDEWQMAGITHLPLAIFQK